jgi:hypothetical protein
MGKVQEPIDSNPQLCSSLNVRDYVSQPYRIRGRIIVLYIEMLMVLDNRQEDKSSGQNGILIIIKYWERRLF